MALFKGFPLKDLISLNPLMLIAVLSEELKNTNLALEAVSEEYKSLVERVKKLEDRA